MKVLLTKFLLLITAMQFAVAQNAPGSCGTAHNGTAGMSAFTGECNNAFHPFKNNHVADMVIQNTPEKLKIRTNVTFVQNASGEGNFSVSNPDHIAFWQGVFTVMNDRLAALVQENCSCSTQPNHYNNTHLEFVPNFIEIQDSLLWDHNNDPNPNTWNSHDKPYLNAIHNIAASQPGYVDGINWIVTTNGIAYDLFVNNNPDNLPIWEFEYDKVYNGVWYSAYPTYELEHPAMWHGPNIYTAYINGLEHLGGQNWLLNDYIPRTAGGALHEYGHYFGLYHKNSCDLNVMNQSSHPNKRTSFTGCQVREMYETIMTKNLRKYVICEDVVDYNIDITTSEVWTNNMKVYNDITIKDDAMLTIKCELHLQPGTRIIVEKGGRLLVEDGGKITGCGLWDGVYAYGEPNTPQTDIPAHAWVRVRLGGIIENSENGIQLIDGAIGWFEDAIFRNNRRAIEISEYDFASSSHIRDCQFILDAEYLDLAGLADSRQVNLEMIYSVDLRDNLFLNQTGTRGGTGLMTMDAGYNVHAVNAGDSKFSGWKYGINAKGGCSINTFSVRDSRFEQCDIGLLVESVDNFEAIDNQFRLCFNPDPGQGDPTTEIGVMTDFCTGYDIAFNAFQGFNAGSSPIDDHPIGVLIKDSGNQPNKVEVNSYVGCYIANLSNGDNKGQSFPNSGGLQYLCNQQAANIEDIVIPQEADDFGIARYQGSKTQPAGNTFSVILPSSGNQNIQNDNFTGPQDMMQYYYKQSTFTEYPNEVTGVERFGSIGLSDCRQMLTGGGNGPEVVKGQMAVGQLPAAETDYQNLLQSTHLASATIDEKAAIAQSKSDFYQLINFGLFAQSLAEPRDHNQYRQFLAKKSAAERRDLEIAQLIGQGRLTQAHAAIAALSGEAYAFYNLCKDQQQSQQSWSELSAGEISLLANLASQQDNRSSMAAMNVLHYYYGLPNPKTIVLPAVTGPGRRKQAPESSFAIFPNPSQGQFKVQLDHNASGQLRVYNMTGIQVLATSFSDKRALALDLSTLEKGMYLIYLEEDSAAPRMQKLILQ